MKEYKQRLDKVLSKFENNTLHLIGGAYLLAMGEKFKLCSEDEYSYDAMYVSLDTVECLIRDLENNNE